MQHIRVGLDYCGLCLYNINLFSNKRLFTRIFVVEKLRQHAYKILEIIRPMEGWWHETALFASQIL